MRKFFVLLVLMAFLTIVWLAIPLLDGRNRQDEERLIGALEAVEQTIVANLSQAAKVDAFNIPSLDGAHDGNVWILTGVAEVQYDYGDVKRESYVAVVESLCAYYQKSECWSVRKLTLGEKILVLADGDGSIPILPKGMLDAAGGPVTPIPPMGVVEAVGGPATPLEPMDGNMQAPLEPEAGQVRTIEIKEFPPPPAVPAWADWHELALLIQTHLKELGYNPGPRDGMIGPRTVTAIEEFQRDHGLTVDGEASEELLRQLVMALHVQQSQR